MKKILLIAGIIAALSLISILALLASSRNGNSGFQTENCKKEIDRFCSNEKNEVNQIRSCLLKYNRMLSSECKKAIDAGNKPHPCKADAKKFCSDVKPGGGRIIACLTKNASKLSSECRSFGAKRMSIIGK